MSAKFPRGGGSRTFFSSKSILITTTILITIKEESYLTISKVVSHFKHGQNREMKN